MKRNIKTGTHFAICIKSDDPDLLTPRMVYRILPDESAARSKFIRVIDNEGEDYLYPANCFIAMDLPLSIERTLLRIPQHLARKRQTVTALKRKTKPSAA